MTGPYTHLVASRDGLFLVGHQRYERVTPGRFFGITVRGTEVYAFEAGDKPWVESHTGRLVRFHVDRGRFSGPEVLAEGLDNGCHQIDFFDGVLLVADTYRQRILRFDDRWRVEERFPVVAVLRRDRDARYVHLNSLHGRGNSLYLLLNHGRDQASEILEVDRDFQEQRRIPLSGLGCHDIVGLEDGHLLVCDSKRGSLVDERGPVARIDALLTRGLSVGVDEIAVGSSLFGARAHRDLIPGFVTFLDRAYRRRARLHLPAAPTQIRRLDACDLSLSEPCLDGWPPGLELAASRPATGTSRRAAAGAGVPRRR